MQFICLILIEIMKGFPAHKHASKNFEGLSSPQNKCETEGSPAHKTNVILRALQPTNMQAQTVKGSPAHKAKPESDGSPAHKHAAVVSPSSPQAKIKFSKLSSPPAPQNVFFSTLFVSLFLQGFVFPSSHRS